MNREARLLFACARQDFLPRHRQMVQELARAGPHAGPIDWERLARTAERQGVLPVVGANLRACGGATLGLPAPLAERMELAVFENALRKEQDARDLATALARLRAAGLEAMLLKGAALDFLVYREPWVVTSHDTDLLLRPLPGVRPGPEQETLRESLYRAGIECDLGGHHDVDMNGVLPIPFARIWEEARPVSFRGEDAWVMAPEDLLISLCINSCRKRFLRLKGLFDIAETVRRLELDWPSLAAKARDYQCEGIVFTALLATAATVGCALPEGVLAAVAPGRLRAALLRGAVAAALRASALPGLSLLLPYASYRWEQAWRSLWVGVRRRRAHRPQPLPLLPTAG